MKKFITGCFHLLRIFTAIILILILLSVIAFQIIFRSGGMPEELKKRIISYGSDFGIYFDCSSIELSPVSGIDISDLKVFESPDSQKAVFTAENVHVKSNLLRILWSNEKLESLTLKDGTFSLDLPTLKDTGLENINIQDLQFEAYRQNSDLILKKISGKGNIANFNIEGYISELFTRLARTKTKRHEKSFISALRQSLTAALEPHKPVLEKLRQELKPLEIQGQVTGNIKLALNAENTAANKIDLDVSVPSSLYRGIWLKSFNGTLQIEKHNFSLSNFNLAIDENEFLKGKANYNQKQKTVSAEFEGQSYPIRFFRLFVTEENSLTTFIRQIKNFGPPPAFKLKIPPCPAGAELTADIEVDVQDTQYKGIHINSATGHLKYTPEELAFTNCKLRANNHNSGLISGSYIFKTGEIYMSGSEIGPPMFVKNFLGPSSSRSYEKFWSDYTWQASYPPVFSFIFRTMVKEPYEFYLTGDVTASNFFANGELVEQFHSDVVLSFTDEIKVLLNGIDYKKGENENLEGSLLYQYTNDDTEYVDYKLKGNIDPKKVFRIIDAHTLLSGLESYQFNPTSRIDSNGHVDLVDNNKTNITATFRAPDLQYDEYHLIRPQGHIKYTDDKLTISKLRHHVYNGLCNGNILYDFSNDTATVDYTGKSLEVETIPDFKGKAEGRGDFTLATTIDYSDDTPLYNGKLSLDITQGKFWKVPLITNLANTLGKILPTSGIGEISSIQMKSTLSGKKLLVDELKTDGDVIALNGKGEIHLAEESVNILFEVKPLSKVLWNLIPTLLKPLTKTIQVRLEGPYDNMQWSPASGLW